MISKMAKWAGTLLQGGHKFDEGDVLVIKDPMNINYGLRPTLFVTGHAQNDPANGVSDGYKVVAIRDRMLGSAKLPQAVSSLEEGHSTERIERDFVRISPKRMLDFYDRPHAA